MRRDRPEETKPNQQGLTGVKRPIEELKVVREWAQEKIQGGQEPPWAWYQYMKLIETVDTILDGASATTTTESSQQSEQHSGKHLRLVASTCPPDSVQHRRAGKRVRLPM
jgi:hypothetical protein